MNSYSTYEQVNTVGGIYRVIGVQNKEHNKTYYTQEYVSATYPLPNKIYGDLKDKAIYIWNSFSSDTKSSVMATGLKGSGKTLFCNCLANIAIEQGLKVIEIRNIEFTDDLCNYISTLKDCVVYVDEVGKLISRYNQDKLLTMLSDSYNKKLFLFTENNIASINDFIRDRPDRIRYHLEFGEMSSDVVNEYCIDHDVPDDFKDKLIKLAVNNTSFCFDHLVYIVKEAKRMKKWDLSEIINLLNVKCLRNIEYHVPIDVTDKETGETYSAINRPILKSEGILMVANVSFNINNFPPFGNKETKTEDEKVKEKNRKFTEFTERLLENYQTVDLSPIDYYSGNISHEDKYIIDRLGYRYDYPETPYRLKVNIKPEMLIEADGKYLTYIDVTGKYKVKTVIHKKSL